jgi:hypothetical protein
MADINRYSTADTLSLSDLFVLWSTVNGDTRKASFSALQSLLVPGGTSSATEYAAPTATGFTATIAQTGGNDVWLVLTPAAGYAAGTIVLPSAANSVHGQDVVVSCSQSVGSLTVSSSGASVAGAPAALSANGFFRLRYESVTKSWIRVG